MNSGNAGNFSSGGETVRKSVEEVNYQMNSFFPVGSLKTFSLSAFLCRLSCSPGKDKTVGMRMQMEQGRVLCFRAVGYS